MFLHLNLVELQLLEEVSSSLIFSPCVPYEGGTDAGSDSLGFIVGTLP